MLIYTALFSVLAITGIIGIGLKKHATQCLYAILVVILALFAGCRANGFDWHSYYEIFKVIHAGGNYEGAQFVEYGFQFLTLLSPTYRILIFITAIISVPLTLGGLYKLSPNTFPLLGLLVYFTCFLMPTYMGQIRQGLALGFVMYAYYYLWRNHRRKALLMVLIGSLFHITALIALLIFFPIRKEFSISTYILGFIITYFASFLALNLMAAFLQLSSSGIAEKIMYYAMKEHEGLGISSTIMVRIATFLIVIMLNKGKSNQITYISNIYYIGICLYLLLGFSPQLAGRGTYYFAIMEFVLVPYIAKALKSHKEFCLGATLLIVALSFYRFYAFFSDDFNAFSYIPYLRY